MAYKMIDELEKLFGRVAGAAMEHRERITQVLAERFRHKLPDGQTIPDVLQLQTWLAEELDEIHAELIASEKGLKAELAEDRRGREDRRHYVSEVRQQLFSARYIFDAIYGAGGAEVMFQESPLQVRVDPVPLHRQGVLVHDNVLDPGFNRPPLRLDVEVNLEKLALGMEPGLEGLRRTLAGLQTGTQASSASLAVKEERMARLERRLSLGVRWLEATYAWAEQPGIASRVRLSSHRASTGRAGQVETEPSGDDAGGDQGGERPAEAVSRSGSGDDTVEAAETPPARSRLRTRPPAA